MKTISKTIAKGSQDIAYKEVLAFSCIRNKLKQEHRLQVRIKSDSYDSQSYAIIERWNGEQWKQAHSIHYAEMSTPHKLAYDGHNQGQRKPLEEMVRNNNRFFQADRNELIRIVKEIL